MTKANASGGVSMSQDELFEFVKSLKAAKAAQDAEIASLKAALAAEKPKAKEPAIRCSVGQKGGLCLHYGSRYPVTLYIQHWDLIRANMKVIDDFVAKNRAQFSTKG